MDRDFQRAKEDVRFHTTILSDWLRGRDPTISVEFFQSLWGPTGGLYSLTPAANNHPVPTLSILLSCTNPVPVPGGGEHF